MKTRWEGYGIFWLLNELMYQDDMIRLDIRELPKIAFRNNIDAEILQNIVAICLEENLYKEENTNFIYSDRLRRHAQKVQEKREKCSKAGEKGMKVRWSNNNVITNVIENDNDPITLYNKVKESKVKESKGKESKGNNIYVAFEKATLANWNSFCTKYPILSQIKEISEERRNKLKKRYEKESFRDFTSILEAISKQDFLLGMNDRKWKVSFDWIIANNTNYLKILEYKYKSENFSGAGSRQL